MIVSFLLFLLTLYLLSKLVPRLMVWWIRRQQRKFEQQMGQSGNRATGRKTSSGSGVQYESSISEDAEFEDIAGPREVVTQETFVAEEQIVDAEFEEL